MARRSRRPTRRRPASRRRGTPAHSTQVPWGVIALGTLALGGAAFLFYRAASAAAVPQILPVPVPPDVTVTTPSRSGGSGSTTYYYDQANRPVIFASTADRLRGSDQARQIFGLQSLIYGFGTTDQSPDGLLSTVNSQLAQLSALDGTGVISPTWNASSYAQVRQWLFGQAPGRSLRSLPYVMPQDLIDQVNASVASTDSNSIYLQALPQQGDAHTLNPAG